MIRGLSVGRPGPILPGPAGATKGGAALGIKRISVPLAKVNSAGTTRTSATVAARIVNPSRRLSCALSVAFELETQGSITTYSSATWTVRALRPGGDDGRESELHTIESGIALPRMYELDSAIRALLVTCSVTIPQRSGTNLAGDWRLVVEWEPNITMCEEEILALYSQCDASLVLKTDPLAP